MSKSKEDKEEEEEEEEKEEEEKEGDEESKDKKFNEIDKLQDSGIQAGDILKLKNAGCYTIESIMMKTKKDLIGIKGLSEAKVDKIVEAAYKICNCGFITGSESLIKRNEIIKLTTGSEALDKLLGGGVETNSITEAFGEFRSGKTQLCHTLCVTAQLPIKKGGGAGKVAYIDTEGTFRPEKIIKIAERFGLDGEQVLDNIIVARAFTHEHQMNLLINVVSKMAEETFRLLIVDSVTALFRVDFSGRGQLSDRQQKLGKYLSCLIKVAEEFNVAVFVTNQVVF
jgi:meiotic recombination protein DMC1